MRLTNLLIITVVAAGAFILAGCNTDANVTNLNTNARVNTNTNMNMDRTNTNADRDVNDPLWDRDITRDEYEKRRGDYEREKGDSVIGSGPNDMWLWVKTKASLAGVDDLRDSTINVDVEDEVVTLRGTVASAAHKKAAEDTAKAVEGVKSVRDQLRVSATDSMTNQMVNGNSANN